MSVLTHWLADRRPEARHARHHARGLAGAVVSVELETVQPIVAAISDNGQPFVGLILEKGNVAVELRVDDPRALCDELDAAVVWQHEQQLERNGTPTSTNGG